MTLHISNLVLIGSERFNVVAHCEHVREVAGREQPRRRGGDPTLVMSRHREGSTFLLRLPPV